MAFAGSPESASCAAKTIFRPRSLGIFCTASRAAAVAFVQRLLELTGAAVDLRHAQVSLRIFWIAVDDDLVLVERSVELAIVQQVLRQATDRIQIVMVEFGGLLVGANRLFVLFFLFVGVGQ